MNLIFLKSLLEAAAPSGVEERASQVFLAEAATFTEHTYCDDFGNSYAEINPEAGRPVVLAGHLDQIGVMVSHIDDQGLIYIQELGGWDSQVLVGQRIRLLAEEGDILAVIGKKPIHLMDAADREKVSKMADMWLDSGLSLEEVRKRVPVGTVGVLEHPVLFVGERVIAGALDNRVGAYIALEVLRALKAVGCRRRVIAVGTAQEETNAYGARLAANRLTPALAVAIDVTFETDQPGVEVKKINGSAFGSGVQLTINPILSRKVLAELVQVAEANHIPYTRSLGTSTRYTATDADGMAVVQTGIPTAVLGIPLRYMHSPNEMVDLRDVRAAIALLVAYLQ